MPWDAHFHHKLSKEFHPSMLMTVKDWDMVKEEIDKCDLLCSACHSDIHMNKKDFYENYDLIIKLSQGNAFEERDLRKATTKEKNRAKELLEQGLSYEEVGNILKFKEPTIRAWCPKNHNINMDLPETEEKIIDLYERKKLNMRETCAVIKCHFRTLRKKILSLISQGKIKEYRIPNNNQYSSDPKKVSINGIIYTNTMDASRKLEVPYSTLKIRLRSQREKWKNYHYIESNSCQSSI